MHSSSYKKTNIIIFAILIFAFMHSARAYENPWIKMTQEEGTIGENTKQSIGAIIKMFMDKTTDFCYKNSYFRASTGLPGKCPKGYIRKGIGGALACYKECKPGYSLDNVGWCRKPNCPSGYSHLSGFICSKNSSPSNTCLRKSYLNTDMKWLECSGEDEENDLGLCYKKCKVGMKGIGPTCWLNCSTTMLPEDCASTCAKNTMTCALKTFQMVYAPLDVVANVAMLVITGGTANVAINSAKTAAKTAAHVAAKQLAKQLLKNFAKNAIKKMVPQIISSAVNLACNVDMKKTQSAKAQQQWGNTTCQAAGAVAGVLGSAVSGKFSAKSFSKLAGETAKNAAVAVAKVGIQRASQEACSRISDKRGSTVCSAGFSALAALTDVGADPQVKSHNIKVALQNFARKDLVHLGVQLGVKLATVEACNAALGKNKDQLPGACDQVAAAVGGMTAIGLAAFDNQAEQALPEKQRKQNKPPKLKIVPPDPELTAPVSVESIRAQQISASLRQINALANAAFSMWPGQGMAGESILPASNGVLTSLEINECKKSKNIKSPLCVLIGLIAKANVFTPMANYFSQYFSDKVTLGSALVGLTDEYVPFYVSLGLTVPEVYDCIDQATKNPNNVPKHCLLAVAISQTEAAYTKIQEVVATTGFTDDGGVEPKNVDDSGSGVNLSMLEALACTKILENSNIDLGSQAAHAKYCKNLFVETAKKSGGKSIDEILAKSMVISDKDAAKISTQRAMHAEIEAYRSQLAAAPDFKNLSNMLNKFFNSAKVEQPELYADYLIDAVAIALANQIVNQDRKKSGGIEGLCDTPKECAYLFAGMVDPTGVVGLVEAYDHSICNGLNKTELGKKSSYPAINSLRAFYNYKSKLAEKQAIIEKCGANPNDPACSPALKITNNDQPWAQTLAADKKRASYSLKITEPDTLDEWYWKLVNGQPTLFVFDFEDQKEIRYDEREAMGALLVPLPTDSCTTEIINKSTGDIIVTKASAGILSDWLASLDVRIIEAVANGTQLSSLGELPKTISNAEKCLMKEDANYKDTLKKIAGDIISPPPPDPVPEILPPPALPVKGSAVATPAPAIVTKPVVAQPVCLMEFSERNSCQEGPCGNKTQCCQNWPNNAMCKPAQTAAVKVTEKTYATFKDYCKDGNNIDPRSFCCLGYGSEIGCKATGSYDVKHIDMCKSVIAQASNANSECCKSTNYLQICNIYKVCASMSNKKRSEYDANYCNKTPKSK